MTDQAIPEPVATAISAVMRGVRRLLKTEWNAEEGYPFASIDGFLEAINPLCAKARLIIIQNEVDANLVQAGPDSASPPRIWVTYEFLLSHASGVTWGPVSRSIMVPADGPQAFGAAQSYALKQFMRSLFQIPTGESDDADFGEASRRGRSARRERVNGVYNDYVHRPSIRSDRRSGRPTSNSSDEIGDQKPSQNVGAYVHRNTITSSKSETSLENKADSDAASP